MVTFYKPTKKVVAKTLALSEATNAVSELISRPQEEYQNHLALKLSDSMTNANCIFYCLLVTFKKLLTMGKKYQSFLYF